jgi:3-oxoacyl-[acyl-carrier protein] reductase
LNLNLEGKRALVCGSSQGIGRACAIALAQLGASVSLFARNGKALQKVMQELDQNGDQQHAVLVADFSEPDQVRKSLSAHIDEHGPCCIVINNSGGPLPGPAHTADAEDYLAAFKLHLVSNQHIVQCALPGMRSVGYGRIINIISTSVKQPLDGLGVSNTIRGAVASWAKTLSNELGQFGITVNNVLPGATRTARLEVIMKNKAEKQNLSVAETEASEKSRIPLRRFGEPEELANAVAFLASPAAAYITGVSLPVDGGRTSCL